MKHLIGITVCFLGLSLACGFSVASSASVASTSSSPHVQQLDLGRYQVNFTAQALDFDSNTSFTQIRVSDGLTSEDLTDKVKDAVSCFAGTHLVGIWISNLHWDRATGSFSHWVQPLRGWMNFYCQGSAGITEVTNFDVVITLQATFDRGKLRLVPDAATVAAINNTSN